MGQKFGGGAVPFLWGELWTPDELHPRPLTRPFAWDIADTQAKCINFFKNQRSKNCSTSGGGGSCQTSSLRRLSPGARLGTWLTDPLIRPFLYPSPVLLLYHEAGTVWADIGFYLPNVDLGIPLTDVVSAPDEPNRRRQVVLPGPCSDAQNRQMSVDNRAVTRHNVTSVNRDAP